MSWASSRGENGESITGLFSHLAEIYSNYSEAGELAIIIKPKETKERKQKHFQRLVYDTLFGYLIGPYSPRYDENVQVALEMDERVGMMENIFCLRCQRKFDDANRLEELFGKLVNIHDSSSDDTTIRSVLKILVLLAQSVPPEKQPPIGHIQIPVHARTMRSDLVMPFGPPVYGDTKMVQPSRFYMHYPMTLFSADDIEEDEDFPQLFSMQPGEGLRFSKFFSSQGSLNDPHELKQSGTLFGGLVQGRVKSLDAKLELPDLADDSGIFEIRIPKRPSSSKRSLEDSALTVTTETKSTKLNQSHSDSAYDTNDVTIWSHCLEIPLSKCYTWETQGRAGPIERPYMTELGPEAMDHFCRMKRADLRNMCPTLDLSPLREIGMAQFIKDLVYVMIGIPSDTFFYNREMQEFVMHEETYVSGLSPETLGSLSEDFMAYGTRYNRLSDFSFPPVMDSFYNEGLIFQAFVGAIRNVLHHFTGAILSIPDNTSLLSLRLICHHMFHQMRFLSVLCQCEQPLSCESYESFPKGVDLLSYVYRETLEAASTDMYPIMLSILQTTCGPYTIFVQNWLFEGTCQDNYREFMIQVQEDYLRFRDKNYWTQGYTLSTEEGDSVPLFLQQFAKDIFICGKSLNLLKACCPRHFLFDISDENVPRISVTYSDEDLNAVARQCDVYTSKMQQTARQQTLSRRELEEKELQRKQDLLVKAKEVAEKEIQRINDEMVQKRRAVDDKKREQFNFLKKQMEEDLQRRADAVITEKGEDKKLVAMANKEEEALTQQELDLERQAKEEIIAHYQRLTEEAALREQRALWHVRRSKLDEERRRFLQSDAEMWNVEMEQFPEGHKLEDLPGWARKAFVEEDQGPVHVADGDKVHDDTDKSPRPDTDRDAELPRWARRFLAQPSQTPDDVDADLPKWARGRFRSDIASIQEGEEEHDKLFTSPAGKSLKALLRRPKTPNVKTSVKLSATHSAYTESEESPTKQTIHTYDHAHASKESEEGQTKPHIKVSSDRNVSKESEGEAREKLNVKLSGHMHATKETEEGVQKPHLKTIAEKYATKESTETKELNVPKLKGREGVQASTETQSTEWKIKKRNLFGHVSQLSRDEFVVSAPRLKRPEQIYASLESDYKDYGIKPRIRMSKQMSATRESQETRTKSKIKISEKMFATKESEFIDYDQLRLEKFKMQNIHGHSSDSTVERLMYGVKGKSEEKEPEGEQVQRIQFIEAKLEPFRYQDVFDMFDKPPEFDLLKAAVGTVYGGMGDYGISHQSDIEMCQFLPLDEVLERSVTMPILSQVRLVNECVLDYYFVDLRCMENFRALRRYLFMEDGDFAQILSDVILEKLASNPRPFELLNPVFLNGALNKAVRSSRHSEDVLVDNLSFAVKYSPPTFQQTAPDCLDCLELHYKVDWPLNIVITDKSLHKYNQVFAFMLQLKRTVWVLKDVWHRLKRDALVHKAGNSPQFRQLHLYRQEMQHFVRVMQEYIASQVIQVTWNEFAEALKKDVHDLDDLHRVHQEYLDKAIFRCLLNKKAHRIMRIIQDIVSLILKFRVQLVNAAWHRDPSSGQMAHSNFASMVQSYKHFKEYSGFLFKIVNKLSAVGYESHFKELLLRLNFNNYYKA